MLFQIVSGCEKIYGKEGVGEEEEGSITIFCRKFFSHSVAKLRRGTVLCCVSQKFRLRKSLWIRGRRKYQDFPAKIFCLAVAKNAVVESFSLSLVSGIEKILMRGWGVSVKIFRRQLLVS